MFRYIWYLSIEKLGTGIEPIRIQIPNTNAYQFLIVFTSIADPDPHGSGPDPKLVFRIRIHQKMKKQINKNVISHFRPVNSGLCVL